MKNKKLNNFIRIFIALFFLQSVVWFVSAADQDPINLDFKVLEQAKQYLTSDGIDLKELPESIRSLNGKRVKITGYFLVPTEAYYADRPVTNFAVSKNAYGCPCCTWGDPPTIFNSVIVYMAKGENVRPVFTPLIEVAGTFAVKKEQFTDDSGHKQLNALYYIKDAKAQKKKQSFLKSFF